MENSWEKTLNDFFTTIKKCKDGEELLNVIKVYDYDEVFVEHLIKVIENHHGSLQSDSICETLFAIYTMGEPDGVLFCLQFVPALLWGYYNILSRKVKWNSSKIEVVLLAIYNKVVQQFTQNSISNSFKLPNLWKLSIYHEPFATLGGTSALTENALSQHEKSDSSILVNGPFQHLDRIPAGFRSVVVKTLLQQYNAYISSYPKSSLISMCNLMFRLSVCGYRFADLDYKHIANQEFQLLQKYPKVPLSGDIIKEMTTSLHFILYNGLCESVIPVLKKLNLKAQYTLCSVGILNTNALLNLFELATKRPEDGFQLLPVIDPTKVHYRKRVKPSMNIQHSMKEFVTPFNAQTPSKSISPPIDTSQNAPSRRGENKTSASSSPPLASADVSPGQFRSSAKRPPTERPPAEDSHVIGGEAAAVNKKLNFLDNPNEQDIFHDVSDMNKLGGSDSTQNLHHIEDELIEYSINTDKTPLINGDNAGNINNDSTSGKASSSSSPIKTLHNSNDETTSEETKM